MEDTDVSVTVRAQCANVSKPGERLRRRNRKKTPLGISSTYLLTPQDYGKFFTKLRKGELIGFRSKTDIAIAKAAKEKDV